MKQKKNNLTKALAMTTLLLITFSTSYSQSIEDGKRAKSIEKFSSASQIFRNLLKSSPTDANVNYLLGEVYFEMGLPDSARMFFANGSKSDPKNLSNIIGLGKLLLDEGKVDEGKILLEKVGNTPGIDAGNLRLLASAYVVTESKDFNQALKYANKAIFSDNKNPESFMALGDVYLEQNVGGLAVTNFEKALELDKNFLKAHLRIGQLYIRARNYLVAQKSLETAISLDAGYAPAYRELGEVFYYQKQTDKATESYKKYLTLADRNVGALTRYASFLFLTKDYPSVITTINEVMKMDSTNTTMMRLLAYSAFEQGKFDEGLKASQRFFKKVNPNKILYSDYEYYGRLLLKNGKDSLGILTLRKALSIDSTKNDLHSDIASALLKSKKYTESALEYEIKIKYSKSPSALDYYYMGNAYFFDKKFEKSDSAFMKVIEIKPNLPIGYLWRARANTSIDLEGKEGKAKPFYEKFIELAEPEAEKNKKDLLEAYNYMGIFYIMAEQNITAKSFFEKLLKLDPENKDAKDLIKKLGTK